MSNAVLAPISFEDYLAFEDASQERHEYVEGFIYAMTGGTLRHNRIAGNIYARLLPRLAGSPCQAFIGDVKLRVRATNSAYYPDVLVSCDLGAADRRTLLEGATLLVEVLSESTASVDRREKRRAYQLLGGLQAYWLVSQELREVEVFLRDASGQWVSIHLVDPQAPLPAPGLPGEPLLLADLYEGTDLA